VGGLACDLSVREGLGITEHVLTFEKCVCVMMLCFIKPILGTRHGAGLFVRSLITSEPRDAPMCVSGIVTVPGLPKRWAKEHVPRKGIADVPPHLSPLEILGWPDPHLSP